MKIHEFEQQSEAWIYARCGKPTASEFKQLITPAYKPRSWTTEMPNTYLCRKLAEWWIDGPLQHFTGFAMGDIGNILEDRAKPCYMLEYEQQIKNVGFVTNDEGTIGCSPDGLIGEDGGIEIKCPEPHTHIRYLLDGNVPDDYLLQVHGSLYVTGRQWWRFFSYSSRGIPNVLVHVNRDEKIIEVIAEVLEEFLDRFEQAKLQMIKANGGEPPKRRETPAATERVKFSWEYQGDGELVP